MYYQKTMAHLMLAACLSFQRYVFRAVRPATTDSTDPAKAGVRALYEIWCQCCCCDISMFILLGSKMRNMVFVVVIVFFFFFFWY